MRVRNVDRVQSRLKRRVDVGLGGVADHPGARSVQAEPGGKSGKRGHVLGAGKFDVTEEDR